MALPTITLAGNVCADPDLRFTASGTAMAKIRVACGERKKDDLGNWVDGDTTFIDCTVWGHVAESAVEQISKGSKVVVIGKLKSSTVEKDGHKTTYFDVQVDSIAVDIRKFQKAEAAVKSDTSDPWGREPSPF